MNVEKKFTPEQIVPTLEQVVAAAETPDHGMAMVSGKSSPKPRTSTEIAETILANAGFDFNHKAAESYYATYAQHLGKQVRLGTVKRMLDEAVEQGLVVTMKNEDLGRNRRYGVSGRAMLYIGRESEAERTASRDKDVRNARRSVLHGEAQNIVLARHASEVERVYADGCNAEGLAAEVES